MVVKRKLLAALLFVGWTDSPGAQAVSDGLADPDKGFQLVEETPLAKGFKAYGGHWQMKNGVLSAGPDAGAKLVLEELVLAEGEVSVEMLLTEDRKAHV